MRIGIGRYGIILHGKIWWFQTRVPTQIKTFRFVSFFREARPKDVDKFPRFPVRNTIMDYEGKRYRYWKAGKDIKAGQDVYEI